MGSYVPTVFFFLSNLLSSNDLANFHSFGGELAVDILQIYGP